eukprot:1158101-Pelagomonas_calceolata.AAC.12
MDAPAWLEVVEELARVIEHAHALPDNTAAPQLSPLPDEEAAVYELVQQLRQCALPEHIQVTDKKTESHLSGTTFQLSLHSYMC